MNEEITDCHQIIYNLTDLKTDIPLNNKHSQLVDLLYKQIKLLKDTIIHLDSTIRLYHKQTLIIANSLKMQTFKIEKTPVDVLQLRKWLQDIAVSVQKILSTPQIKIKEVEVPIFVQKEVVVQKIVQKLIEVPVEVQKLVYCQKLIEVQKPIFVDRQVGKPIYIQKIVQVTVQKPVYIERTVEVERPIFVQKLIETPCPKCRRK